MRHRTVWAAIRAYFRDFGYNRAKESYETATKTRCVLSGELEEKLSLAQFYSDQTASTDPWKDHHGFADYRQKYLDAVEDCDAIREKLVRQREIVWACHNRLIQETSQELHPVDGGVPVES